MTEEGKQAINDFDAAVNDLNSTTEPDGLPESEQPSQAEPATTTQGATEPAEPVFDIDGEKVPASTVKQWKSGNMMQADYTRKTQELAKEREQLTLMRQAFEESLYGENADLARPPQQPKPTAGKFQNIPVEENIEFSTPVEEKLYREVQELRGAVGSLYQRQRMEQVHAVNAKIDNAINSFMQTHPEVDSGRMNEVLARANKIGVRDATPESFEYVYRSMLDPADIEKRAIARYVDEQKKKAPAALESPAGVSSDAPVDDIRNLDEEGIYQRMLRDLRMESNST